MLCYASVSVMCTLTLTCHCFPAGHCSLNTSAPPGEVSMLNACPAVTTTSSSPAIIIFAVTLDSVSSTRFAFLFFLTTLLVVCQVCGFLVLLLGFLPSLLSHIRLPIPYVTESKKGT